MPTPAEQMNNTGGMGMGSTTLGGDLSNANPMLAGPDSDPCGGLNMFSAACQNQLNPPVNNLPTQDPPKKRVAWWVWALIILAIIGIAYLVYKFFF